MSAIALEDGTWWPQRQRHRRSYQTVTTTEADRAWLEEQIESIVARMKQRSLDLMELYEVGHQCLG